MKFYMNEQEQELLSSRWPNLYNAIKDYIELYQPIEPLNVMSRINAQLRDDYQRRLGELAVEQGYRVAPDPEVPGLRGLGARPSQVIFDESHNLAEVYESGSNDVVASRWMEHRRVCRRTLLECLSGETC